MNFLKKHYFAIISIVYLICIFWLNKYSIDNIFLLYFSIFVFCFIIRINRRYGTIISNTILASIALQIFVPVFLSFGDFKTLPPNLRAHVEIDTNLLRGLDEEIVIGTDEREFRSLHSKNTYKKMLYLVGGSTTEQLTISDYKTTAAILEQMLVEAGHRINVVNTGLSGLRAPHHASTIRHTQSDDTVGYIILVGVNDWNRLLQSQGFNRKMSFLLPKNWLLTHAARRLAEILGREFRTPNAYHQAVMNSYRDKPKVDFEIRQEHRNDYSARIREIEDVCENLPGEQFCVFVSQPHGYLPAELRERRICQILVDDPAQHGLGADPEIAEQHRK